MFTCTFHWCSGALGQKLPSNLLLRRSVSSCCLLAAAVRDSTLLSATNSVLSQLLAEIGIRLRKNSSKAAKIEALLKSGPVTTQCSEAEIEELRAKLQVREQRRARRTRDNENEEEEEEANPEGDYEAGSLSAPVCTLSTIFVYVREDVLFLGSVESLPQHFCYMHLIFVLFGSGFFCSCSF